MASIQTMRVRMRCCACGRVERFTAPVPAAFALADDLMKRPCSGGTSRRCNSRDRRLEISSADAPRGA